MRIGILTQALHGNYGGILQNYALHQVLRQMGHCPVTIDRHIRGPESRGKKIVKVLLRNLHKYYDSSMLTMSERHNLCAKQLDFVERHIDRIGPIYTQADFDKIVSDSSFDTFIVGSDQCWRPCYSANICNYYLDFASDRDIKRIVYAASFGVDKWEYSEAHTAQVAKAAKFLNAVSVREESGMSLCSKYLGVDATWVLDPTMLLCAEGFKQFITTPKALTPFLTEYLLEYSADVVFMMDEIKKQMGIAECRNNNNNLYFHRFASISRYSNISIEEWISNIANARLVITDSFHGVVFSILFNTPFVVHLNGTRGNTRIESLLKDFGLENCIVEGIGNVNIPEIDWERVNSHLNKRREYSLNFLEKALS